MPNELMTTENQVATYEADAIGQVEFIDTGLAIVPMEWNDDEAEASGESSPSLRQAVEAPIMNLFDVGPTGLAWTATGFVCDSAPVVAATDAARPPSTRRGHHRTAVG